jgi:hypothetical protein
VEEHLKTLAAKVLNGQLGTCMLCGEEKQKDNRSVHRGSSKTYHICWKDIEKQTQKDCYDLKACADSVPTAYVVLNGVCCSNK